MSTVRVRHIYLNKCQNYLEMIKFYTPNSPNCTYKVLVFMDNTHIWVFIRVTDMYILICFTSMTLLCNYIVSLYNSRWLHLTSEMCRQPAGQLELGFDL